MDFKGLMFVSHRLHRFSQILDSFGVFSLRFGDNRCLQQDYLCISVRSVGELKISLAALHTEGAEDGSEDGDDEVNDFLDCFFFHCC